MPAPPRRPADPFLGPIVAQFRASLIVGLADAMTQATRDTSKVLQEIARIAQAGVAREEFARAHLRIARAGQQAVLNSYSQTVKKNPPYRVTANKPKNVRYAGGLLKAAIADPSFFTADADGISFINTSLLDRQAKHWHRLNFGAAPAGQGSRRSFDVVWSNLVVASLGLNEGPSPAFFVPRGYWWNGNEFHPVGEGPRARVGADAKRIRVRSEGRSLSVPITRRMRSRGIRGRNFFDAGLHRIAKELGPTYERMHADLFDKKIAQVRPASSFHHVVVHRRYR